MHGFALHMFYAHAKIEIDGLWLCQKGEGFLLFFVVFIFSAGNAY